MTDPVSAARGAREKLAQGLAALQSPGVPPNLMDVAEPVAQAMSALHQIESTGGGTIATNAPAALDAVRRALAMLQTHPGGHPAVEQAIEAVASSLGLIHGLSQHAPAAPVQPQAAFAGTVVMDQGGPASAAPATQPSAPAPYAAPAQQAPPQQWQQPPAQQPPPQQWQQPPAQQPPPQQWQQPPAQQPPPQQAAPWAQQQPQQPYAAPPAQQPQQPYAAPPAQQPYGAPPQQWQDPAQAAPPQQQAWNAPAAPRPDGGAPARVEAELGAHSSTNFYKGLSGNDVIDSGGIFIATYQIPPIGQDLVIKVSLPGGYEFEAAGIVRWTRDAPNSGADSPPGFGAQFTQISPEGRQLVYRYVRNREPLFHDDL